MEQLKINKKNILLLLLLSIIMITVLYFIFFNNKRFEPYGIKEKIILKNIKGENKYFIHGTFKVKSKCFLNSTTEGMYIIPLDSNRKVLKDVQHLLFYAPFNGEDGTLAYKRYSWLRIFSEEHNFAIFSIRIKTDVDNVNNKYRYYIYKEAGWFDGILKIQYFLQEKFNLPKNKLFAIGQSSGCSIIQRMAVDMPTKFAAVAGHGGSRFSKYFPNQKFPPALFSSTCGDLTNIANRENFQNAINANIKLWYMETVPKNNQDFHGASKQVFEVLTKFILSAKDNNLTQSSTFKQDFEKMPLFVYPWEKLKIFSN